MWKKQRLYLKNENPYLFQYFEDFSGHDGLSGHGGRLAMVHNVHNVHYVHRVHKKNRTAGLPAALSRFSTVKPII